MFDFLLKRNDRENPVTILPQAISSTSQMQTSLVNTNSNTTSLATEERSVVDDLEELMKYKPSNDGMERIKDLFRSNVFGFRSFELMSSYKMACGAFWIGLFYKGRAAVKPAVDRWKIQHNHSLFVNKNEYQRRLSTFMMTSALKEGGMAGLKYGAFIFTFSFIAQAIAAYRDKLKCSDVIVSGALSGGLYRFYFGLTATCVGTITGTIFGSIMASVIYCTAKLSQKTVDEFYKDLRQRFFESEIKNNRENAEVKRIADESEVSYFTARRLYREQQKAEELAYKEYLKSKVS